MKQREFADYINIAYTGCLRKIDIILYSNIWANSHLNDLKF